MSALTDQQRNDATRYLGLKIFEELKATANMNTADLKAAVIAMDDYIETNLSAINGALPLPFRTTATTAQKAMVLAVAAMKKGGII